MLQDQTNQIDEALYEEKKDKITKFFMMDYLEFNMRRIAFENIRFCSDNCNIFSNLKTNQNQTQEDEIKELSCFEKCLGKFTDSYEHAIDIAGV